MRNQSQLYCAMYKCCIIIFLLLIGVDVSGQGNTATDDYIGLYQKYISSQKNSRCAMYPSCSAYGKMVFSEKPFYEAMFMLTDRIIRCSHDRKYYDETYEYGNCSLVDFPDYKRVPVGIVRGRYASPHTDNFGAGIDINPEIRFINSLINKEKYESALVEIEREMFYASSADNSLYANKLLCYRGLNNYEDGIFEYETEFPNSVKASDDVAYQAALLYYCTSNYGRVEKLLNDVVDSGLHSETWEKAYLLKGIVDVRENRLGSAKAVFENATFLAERRHQYEVNVDAVNRMMRQKYKSPTLARVLSIIPGGGYLYTNHRGSALTAFAINALLGYATYTSIKSENYGVAGVCGFLGFSFYIGNINGAGKSAVRYNERVRNSYVKELEINNHIFY